MLSLFVSLLLLFRQGDNSLFKAWLGLQCPMGGVGGSDLCQDFLDKFQAGTLLVLKKLDGEEEKTVNEVEISQELK